MRTSITIIHATYN